MNRFDSAAFTNFHTTLHGKPVAALEEVLRACQNFTDSLNHCLWIYGPPGVGKTHLCYAAKNELRKKRQQVNLISFHDMIPWLREKSSNHKRKLEAFQQSHILVIDDFERLYLPNDQVDPEAQQVITTILDLRASRRLPTLIASWDHPQDILPDLDVLRNPETVIFKIESEDFRQIRT